MDESSPTVDVAPAVSDKVAVEVEPAVAAEGPTTDDIGDRHKKIEKFKELMAEGKKAYITVDLDTSCEVLAEATQLAVELFGVFAAEVYEPHLYYGKSMLDYARMEQDIFSCALKGMREQFLADNSESSSGDDDDEAAAATSSVEEDEKLTEDEQQAIIEQVDVALQENAAALEKVAQKSENSVTDQMEIDEENTDDETANEGDNLAEREKDEKNHNGNGEDKGEKEEGDCEVEEKGVNEKVDEEDGNNGIHEGSDKVCQEGNDKVDEGEGNDKVHEGSDTVVEEEGIDKEDEGEGKDKVHEGSDKVGEEGTDKVDEGEGNDKVHESSDKLGKEGTGKVDEGSDKVVEEENIDKVDEGEGKDKVHVGIDKVGEEENVKVDEGEGNNKADEVKNDLKLEGENSDNKGEIEGNDKIEECDDKVDDGEGSAKEDDEETDNLSEVKDMEADDNEEGLSGASIEQNIDDSGVANEDMTDKSVADDDIDQLQIAWEALEVAKTVCDKYINASGWKERKAEVLIVLGECSVENEHFAQAIEDYDASIEIQKQIYEPSDRRLSQAYFCKGRALCLNKQFAEAVDLFLSAKKVLELRLAKLEKRSKNVEDEDHKIILEEIKELRNIIPDVDAKIIDADESATALAKAEAKCSGDADNVSTVASTFNAVVTDISDLVRKKAKRGAEESEEVKAKRVKDEASSNGVTLDR